MTLSHPHGQIYGYPFVTPTHVAACSLWCSSTTNAPAATCSTRSSPRSSRDGTRVIDARTSTGSAFVPGAARWPFEVHLYPRQRVPDLPALSDERARRVRRRSTFDVLRAFDRLFDVPMPYISGVAPGAGPRPAATWPALHLGLFSTRRDRDKLKYLAGSESGMGAFVNDVSPGAGRRVRCATPFRE